MNVNVNGLNAALNNADSNFVFPSSLLAIVNESIDYTYDK